MVKICVLGPLRVEVEGRTANFGSRLARAILAQLLIARGASVSADRLVRQLWRAAPPPSARASLQAYVAQLRRVLEPDRPPRAPMRLLISAPHGYALRLSPDQHLVDAWQFESELAACLALPPDHHAEVARRLKTVLELWSGPAYAEFADEPWAADERARLENLRCAGREALVTAHLNSGAPQEALAEADALTRDQPLREEGWRLLAVALWAVGRQGDALAALRRIRDRLRSDLGVVPGPELVALEQAVLQQRLDVLYRFTRPAAATTATATEAREGARTSTPAPEAGVQAAPTTAPGRIELIGRDTELAELDAAAARVRQGQGQVVLLSGEAGIGKSSLLDHLVGALPPQGWLVAGGQCPETDGAPPGWAWLTIVGTLTASVPLSDDLGLLLSGRGPGAAAWTVQDGNPAHRFRLHQAFLSWLRETAAERPVALYLDDLHRADEESLELFLLCAEQLRTAAVLLVAAYRPGEDDMTRALDRLARCYPVRLPLDGLPAAQARHLVQRVCPVEVSERAAVALAERTGGNPFYLRESALLLAEEGEERALARIPQGILDTLRRRFARFEPADLAVLRLMAVAGRRTAVDLLTAAADVDEERVLDALDAGVAAGLVVEPSIGQVRFCHALVREALEADLTEVRRARMHSKLGHCLLKLGSRDVAAIAHHFLRSGAVLSADAPLAVEYAQKAAEQAVQRHAPHVGEALLDEALRCLELRPALFAAADAPALEVALLGRLVRIRVRLGAILGAQEALGRAVELARGHGRDDLMAAAYSAWSEPTPWQSRGYGITDAVAVADLTRLLDGADLEPRRRCLLLDRLACAHDLADARALEPAREAVALARGLGEPRLVAQSIATLVKIVDFLHGPDTVVTLHRELAGLTEAGDLPEYAWIARYTAARVAAAANDLPALTRCLDLADELARDYELAGTYTLGLLRHPMLAMAQGRYEESEQALFQAVDVLRAQGMVNLEGFVALAVGCLRLQQGRLAETAPAVLAVYEQIRPANEALPVLALLATGDREGARRIHAERVPLRRDFSFALQATLRAMAVVALDDRAEAAELYVMLSPFRDQVAGATTLSVALRPVAQSLGELALLLGRVEEAREHFGRAERVAGRWNSRHWADDARAALAALANEGPAAGR
ncbi:BTAD domain-containing putative transcriptional regulator [Streptomyces sp. NPDC090106]|uniref:BTAD domain-containing putative transcriptional regulator n=1 Tax=Streptomyces sp. NPDC090106 TaxID=3365946 RepID=UPI003818E237